MGLMPFEGGIEVIFEALVEYLGRSGGNGVSRDRSFELTYIEFYIIGLIHPPCDPPANNLALTQCVWHGCLSCSAHYIMSAAMLKLLVSYKQYRTLIMQLSGPHWSKDLFPSPL